MGERRHDQIPSPSMDASILDELRRCAPMIEPLALIPEHRKIDLYNLPPFIGELSCGISRQFQIDPVIVFGTILGCVAAATQGKIRTRISANWIEHSSMYIINIAETGDGKSQVMNLLRKPIDDYESQLRSDALSDYSLRKAEHEIAENKLKAIKDSMSKAKAKNPATRADLMQAIDDVAAAKPKPIPQVSIGGDVTPDALTDLLLQNPALSILDAEGTLYSHLSGKRHGTGSMWETILQAFTGDAQVKNYIHNQVHTLMLPWSCHIRATSCGIKWISMVRFGVRFGGIVWQSLRFTRDYADLRSRFSLAGVAQW